jgi:hypothetical protein
LQDPPNALLWGCECWNPTKRNLNKLRSFHHSAIRRILTISWNQVRCNRITNKKVRFLFCNIPDVDTFITRRTARYIGKISRLSRNSYPRRFLNAWIDQPRKTGAPLLSCHNNFVNAIANILPNGLNNKQAALKESPLQKMQTHGKNTLKSSFKAAKQPET